MLAHRRAWFQRLAVGLQAPLLHGLGIRPVRVPAAERTSVRKLADAALDRIVLVISAPTAPADVARVPSLDPIVADDETTPMRSPERLTAQVAVTLYARRHGRRLAHQGAQSEPREQTGQERREPQHDVEPIVSERVQLGLSLACSVVPRSKIVYGSSPSPWCGA